MQKLLLSILAYSLSLNVTAAPLPLEKLPNFLKDWVPWVMHEDPAALCPKQDSNGAQGTCAWPSKTDLNITNKGGTFSTNITMFASGLGRLPGNEEIWPQNVEVNGQRHPVMNHNGTPGIRLNKGTFKITGSFFWNELPSNISVPSETGLITLTVNGVKMKTSSYEGGQLLTNLQNKDTSKKDGDALTFKINRLIDNNIPLTVETRYTLEVAGNPREVELPNPVLGDLSPLSVTGDLPVKLIDNKLKIQAKAGTWTITTISANTQQVSALKVPDSANSEIWAVKLHPELHAVNIQGLRAIDPKQTTIPQEWHQFQTFQANKGETLNFKVTRRGDASPAPDQLELDRTIWLDFNGNGYSIKDKVSGDISQSWRLSMSAPQMLGRVSTNGVDQFITKTGDSDSGVELRHGNLNLEADSRLDSNSRTLMATGWNHDFNKLRINLNVPPGWKLMHATGADQVSGAWISKWTLWDVFIVMLITLTAKKLLGWKTGVLAGVTLLTTYHIVLAPVFLWLYALVALALVTAFPGGNVNKYLHKNAMISLAALSMAIGVFGVQQARQVMYPTMEKPGLSQNVSVKSARTGSGPTTDVATSFSSTTQSEEGLLERGSPGASHKLAGTYMQNTAVARYTEPASYSGAVTQTGPGMPSWRWNSHTLNWSGPVEKNQQISIWLLPPFLGNIWIILGFSLSVMLLMALWQKLGITPLPTIKEWGKHTKPRPAMLMLFSLALSASVVTPNDAYAQEPQSINATGLNWGVPDEQTLQTLKQRITAPPDCAPNCTSIPRVFLEVSDNHIQLRLEAHLEVGGVVVLPGNATQWMPQTISVSPKQNVALNRTPEGTLQIALPAGVHQVILTGTTTDEHTLNIELPPGIKHFTHAVAGWDISGVSETGKVGESIQLVRILKKPKNVLTQEMASDVRPLIQVDRNINLGSNWNISTSLTRIGQNNTPVQLKIPLLAGESITTPGIVVINGYAVINMGAQSQQLNISSVLPETKTMSLTATKDANQIQVWNLQADTMWHVDYKGLVPTLLQSTEKTWSPKWQPWPGEEVTLNITRPEGIKGQTVTMDNASMAVTPGIRATDITLSLNVRSSRGGVHVVKIPEGAQVQKITINGLDQVTQLEKNREIHLDLSPGSSLIQLIWREPRGLTTLIRTPNVDLGVNGVNLVTHVYLAKDRWVLFTGGPVIGPVILIWGIIIVIGLAAYVLGNYVPKKYAPPLSSWAWFLLGLGLVSTSLVGIAIVVGWLFALAMRQYVIAEHKEFGFNLRQLILVVWTMLAITQLFYAVWTGLLGLPDMRIEGNLSNALDLSWYQDRSNEHYPSAWVLSISMWWFRGLMLLWALWLSTSLLTWLKWGWTCFTTGGYWQQIKRRKQILAENQVPAQEPKP